MKNKDVFNDALYIDITHWKYFYEEKPGGKEMFYLMTQNYTFPSPYACGLSVSQSIHFCLVIIWHSRYGYDNERKPTTTTSWAILSD